MCKVDKVKDIKLLFNGKTMFDQGDEHYVIPLYQRAFSWGTESYNNRENEIIQLMDDILDAAKYDSDYFLGSLIVFRRPDQECVFEVIDGQQRLTALYLLFVCLGIEIKKKVALSYDCRPKADYALEKISVLISNPCAVEEDCDHGICLGIKTIKNKIEIENKKDRDNGYSKRLKEALNHVHLFQIQVPKCTDLNRYFEIMNTRGEQLEQHDIVKAFLMSAFTDETRREIFAKVWNACRDMTGYIQMHFKADQRALLFGKEWTSSPCLEIIEKLESFEKHSTSMYNLYDITKPEFNIDALEEDEDSIDRNRFESIIDFQHFLLHVLNVFASNKFENYEKLMDEQLDDKKLISTFKHVQTNGRVNGEQMSLCNFAWGYMKCLLYCRFLFDKYIIKREYYIDQPRSTTRKENNEGKWSLMELKTYQEKGQNKPKYSPTELALNSNSESTERNRTTTNKMLQACLRVSYTSPKTMHWITEALKWLYSQNEETIKTKYNEFIEMIATVAVNKFVSDRDYQQGVSTPHIVLNYLDYLLWRNGGVETDNFNFEFRNSVEHWYPQNPSESIDGCNGWNPNDGNGNCDRFGNLALLPSSINSRFSSQSPTAKLGYEKIIADGSLKLRLMANITKGGSSEDWRTRGCKEHEEQMLSLLKNACQKAQEFKI